MANALKSAHTLLINAYLGLGFSCLEEEAPSNLHKNLYGLVVALLGKGCCFPDPALPVSNPFPTTVIPPTLRAQTGNTTSQKGHRLKTVQRGK